MEERSFTGGRARRKPSRWSDDPSAVKNEGHEVTAKLLLQKQLTEQSASEDDDSDEEDEGEDEVLYEVRKYLRTHPREPGYTRKELLSLIEGIELTSQQWHELISDGQVVSTGAGQKHTPFRYSYNSARETRNAEAGNDDDDDNGDDEDDEEEEEEEGEERRFTGGRARRQP